jgi:hypothetical protein
MAVKKVEDLEIIEDSLSKHDATKYIKLIDKSNHSSHALLLGG